MKVPMKIPVTLLVVVLLFLLNCSSKETAQDNLNSLISSSNNVSTTYTTTQLNFTSASSNTVKANDEWYNNNWFISITSTIGGIILLPLLTLFGIKIMSVFGIYSGYYIALTGDVCSKKVIIEYVRCKHWGNKIKGTIFGVSYVRTFGKEIVLLSENKNQYNYEGKVKDRALLLTYTAVDKKITGCGAIALCSHNTGDKFIGTTVDVNQNQTANENTVWQRIDIKDKKKVRDEVLEYAAKYLPNVQNVKDMFYRNNIAPTKPKIIKEANYSGVQKEKKQKDILVGKWINEWVINGNATTEEMEITNDNKYFVRGEYFYNVQEYRKENNGKRLYFKKVAIKTSDNRTYSNDVLVVNRNTLKGYETNDKGERYQITYTRMK